MWVSTHLLDLPQGTQTPIPPDNSADPQFAPATIILSLAGAKTMTFAPAIFMRKCVGRREAQGRSEQSDPGELEGVRPLDHRTRRALALFGLRSKRRMPG